ncbi:ABR126Wp [Eremothecium gossypii ATCC 10895]|uniref:ABR126Wp n=1 Tax=Eremothecium gossypii (strain ATCC 10895 / CBS 109.51 / FGSC 9923 / NRRL Y-1056) TaxID=284811 RepID=Q75D98_EREGS|nr:ABR126Wp [Eremothecium gossypii ATCC 10895]AAS50897.2 ABR126Wp [Eremothecium gossypii ATCC 10895]AEY95186.1 FABR126Wp [Eremothecium gossypii FDAG1]
MSDEQCQSDHQWPMESSKVPPAGLSLSRVSTGASTSADPAHRPYVGLAEDREEQEVIRSLARTLSGSSGAAGRDYQTGTADELAFFGANSDPRLDPESGEFDSQFFVRTLRKLYMSDPDHYKPAELSVVLRNLRVCGEAADTDYQATVGNWPWKTARSLYDMTFRRGHTKAEFDILKPLDAVFEAGRLCVVLGRPGAGCSTLLKTVGARTYGFNVAPESEVSYSGFTQKEISKNLRGEVIYSAEMDTHFASLPVGYTLEFAARCRCPQVRPGGVSRETYYKHYASAVMATYGLSHTRNTKVGNDYIRGVSGGERKRVSLAEVTLAGAKVQCWDNSTRGLDSATALEFVRALRDNAHVMHTTQLIAIYQCSQDAYDLFDDVLVLYEGYMIYFGPREFAKDYFLRMGWACPPQQTSADYLTSVTSPAERQPRPGYEDKVPRTAKEFYDRWMASPERAAVQERINMHMADYETGVARQQLKEHHKSRQAKHMRPSSPYLISFYMQFRAVVDRNLKRLGGDPWVYLFNILSNTIMGLILASCFFNQKEDTASFFYRGSALFTAVLFNSFSSMLEIMSLFEARAIVEKHKSYAFYRPSADAFASIFTELPSKVITCVSFNIPFYFMVNLRRSAGAFFFYLLISMTSTFAMSHLFRTLGAATTSLYVTMLPASILLLAISTYVGFVIPQKNIVGWSKWIFYLNPIARSMEAMVANEFDGRTFECSQMMPSGPAYENVPLANKVCVAVGSLPGETTVSGTRYMELSYDYLAKHKWRNWAIVLAYAIFFLGLYLLLIEYNKGEMQKGEMAVFLRSTLKKIRKQNKAVKGDVESGNAQGKESSTIDSDQSRELIKKIGSDKIFHWRNVCYDVQIKKETRRILTNVDGWVKPGTLTALMGSSGAGKTTLLDVLANRVRVGVVTGDMFVDGLPRGASFQRNTGYCQQQDLHGCTQTVRDALKFSAYLRQPQSVSEAEKDAYVEDIIRLLEMEAYADAIVGVTGEGLNVEQRKRLTIGVELVAKPELLLFLDEPTSGLDSQTAWSVCQLMRKLANHGQAVLCTIHQPSAILMQEFDRLLLLASGGRTVYFGGLGKGCATMVEYFEKHGSQKFPEGCNPAEFMLEIIGAAPGSHALQDYHEVWKNSEEYRSVQEELLRMETELSKKPRTESPEQNREFAASLWYQYKVVSKRVFQQYWRSPGYLWSKIFMGTFSALFIGFSFFKSKSSMQGMQNQMFATFLFLLIINPLIQQMLPQYEEQRDLYEVRERHSKTFSWKAFILSQLTAELPWAIFVGTLAFFSVYYPVGFYNNAVDTSDRSERGFLFWLLAVCYYIFSATFGYFCIALLGSRESAAMFANFVFMIWTVFCGVLVNGDNLPRFWIWAYRISPLTYLVSSIMSTGMAKAKIQCAPEELVKFIPPAGQTCEQYLRPFQSYAQGTALLNPTATDLCTMCPMQSSDTFLAGLGIYYKNRWRDWGIFMVFIFTNIAGFILFYWFLRVPKATGVTIKKATNEEEDEEKGQQRK